MFLCYVGSIEDQFEFLQRRWSNSGRSAQLRRSRPDHRPERKRCNPAAAIDFPTPDGTVELGRAGRLGYADGRRLFLRADDLGHPRCPGRTAIVPPATRATSGGPCELRRPCSSRVDPWGARLRPKRRAAAAGTSDRRRSIRNPSGQVFEFRGAVHVFDTRLGKGLC